MVYYKKSEAACSATECGTDGTISITYTACAPGGEGCVPHVTEPAATSKRCSGPPCDPCATKKCVAESTQSETKSSDSTSCTCNCMDGWEGGRCHRKTGDEAPPMLDKDGKACASGVLDRKRTCCTEGIDQCGYCTGASRPLHCCLAAWL